MAWQMNFLGYVRGSWYGFCVYPIRTYIFLFLFLFLFFFFLELP